VIERVVGAVAAAALVGGLAGTIASLASDPAHAAPAQVTADAVLAGEPRMGVACRGCDRVGLAIELRRPARAVRATIAGRPLRLAGSGTRFAGFLDRAGVHDRMHVTPDAGEVWWGSEAPAPVVELRIGYADGRVAETILQVHLMATFG
jgi:hypothetical protein